MSEAPPAVDLRVLGPLELHVDGAQLPLPGGKPRALLAVLAVNRNRVVAADSIADAIWDSAPPAAYLASLQVFMSTLRRTLRQSAADGQVRITTQPPGYRLTLDDSLIDIGRFGRATVAGNELFRSRRYAEAAEQFRAALGEWSGRALADLRGLRFADDFAAAVEEDRLLTLQARIEADLACGRDAAVVPELTRLTAEHPLREPFWVQLAKALYRLGRQADALAALRRIREVLSEELGIDPGSALREVERQILNQEPLDAPAAAEPTAGSDAGRQPAAMLPTVSDSPVVLSAARVVLPSGDSVPVPTRGLRIGRMDDNDLVIDGEKVSRYHAVVVQVDSGFAINDLRSTNGTTVGVERVVDSRMLRDRDVIRIGGTELIFHAG